MTPTNALRAARACILQDRTSFAECNVRDDGSFEEFDAEALAEYDAVLAQIDEALASEQEPEPVAWAIPDDLVQDGYGHSFMVSSSEPMTGIKRVPLYTHPASEPEAQPVAWREDDQFMDGNSAPPSPRTVECTTCGAEVVRVPNKYDSPRYEPLCPRPGNNRPDTFTMAECILAGECGCTVAGHEYAQKMEQK